MSISGEKPTEPTEREAPPIEKPAGEKAIKAEVPPSPTQVTEPPTEKMLKAIVTIADAFESLGGELKALIAEITETGDVEHITDKNGHLLARVVRRASDIIFLPRENLGIKVDHGAIQSFLVKRVLEGMKKKYQLSYTLESTQGVLKAIRVEGSITDEIAKDLMGPVQWALTHALEPTGPAMTKAESIFPKELADLLTFEEKTDVVVIKPKSYLGHENFAKIASIVRESGGEYVSAGKASHFRLPK